jgi:hypothetical protein
MASGQPTIQVEWQHREVTTNAKGYETYPRPAPFVAPERWEQPEFAAAPQLVHPSEDQSAATWTAAGERETE